MNLKELRRREDFDAVLAHTIETSLADWHGAPLSVSIPAKSSEQTWFLHPVFSAYCARAPSPRARRFLANSFRYTAVRYRAPLQFLLGTLLATKPAIQMLAPAAFSVSPALSGATSRVLLPGNRRIRLFDFDSSTCAVFVKHGFSLDAVARELGVRQNTDGPFPRVLEASESGKWFVEELLEGWALARCPPWRSGRRATKEAFAALDRWRMRGREEVPARDYAEQLRARIVAASSSLRARGMSIAELEHDLDSWVDAASAMGEVGVSPTHGDFQPGNVFVRRSGGTAILDWEYSARRFEHYDRFVYALRARFGGDLARTYRRYLHGDDFGHGLPGARLSLAKRRAGLATFLLENLLWRVNDLVDSPFESVPPDLLHEIREAKLVTPVLRGGGMS